MSARRLARSLRCRICVAQAPHTGMLHHSQRIGRRTAIAVSRTSGERMYDFEVLLAVVLVLGMATLAVAIGTLRSSRRSEELGEGRYELLRDQHERLELLREERRVLVEELKRESQERQQFTE